MVRVWFGLIFLISAWGSVVAVVVWVFLVVYSLFGSRMIVVWFWSWFVMVLASCVLPLPSVAVIRVCVVARWVWSRYMLICWLVFSLVMAVVVVLPILSGVL